MWQLSRYLKPYWKIALLAPLCMVLEVYMDLLQPKFMADILNFGLLKRDFHHIQITAVWMLCVLIVGLIAGVGCNVFATMASLNFGADVRDALFAKVQSFSFHDLDRFKTGSLITRLTNDVVQMQNFVQMSLQMLVRAPGLAIGSIIMALTISLRLGMILVVATPVLGLFLYLLIRFSYPLFSKVQAKLDSVNTVVQENLAGIRVVKAFVRFIFETDRFRAANEDYTNTAVKASRVVALNLPVMNLIMNGSIVAVIWFGGRQVWGNSLQVGDLVAFINYVTQVLSSLMMVSMIILNISQAKVSADRINQVLVTAPDIVNPGHPQRDVICGGRVEFENVSFSYNASNRSEKVLSNVTFSVDPGKTVALIGSTGAGKSTLVNLIPRLYDVSNGSVRIDGTDIRKIDLTELRTRIGMVLQESILFTGTIRDNICFGKPDASQDEIETVAEVAQAHDFIMKMPDGYDTKVGQRGSGLSGGQKQRIAIARALLVRPRILILDDSTSAIDLGTEARLQRELKMLMKQSTTFVIAQRISSVMDADTIVVLENGQVVGLGTHLELMTTCPVYQDIYRSQIGMEAVSHG